MPLKARRLAKKRGLNVVIEVNDVLPNFFEVVNGFDIGDNAVIVVNVGPRLA